MEALKMIAAAGMEARMQQTQRLYIEVDARLYVLLERAAQADNCSVEEECIRRLEEGGRRSVFLQATIADLRADEAQRLINGHHG